MKVSKYVTDIEIDDVWKLLYSTVSRQYYVYAKKEEKEFKNFLNEINKGIYSNEEIELIKILLNKKIVLKDEVDELMELEYIENSAKYQENVYRIMLHVTNACNFRCVYCVQSHEATRMDDVTCEKVLKLISNQARKHKKIEISWFGGEPLLEYETICSLMEQARQICADCNCELIANITTNGYLLTSEKAKKLRDLNIVWMQITIDGKKENHDKNRMLINGMGTYERVFENILSVLSWGIHVILRINVNEQNISDVEDILDAIPEGWRRQVTIDICNIFQNKEKISTFRLLKKAIEKGYIYNNRQNRYIGCLAGVKSALTINADGSVLLCSNTSKGEKRLGYLGNSGNVCIERIEDYYEIHTISALKNPECQGCIELPFCMATCVYARTKCNTKCLGKRNDGLTLEERALLDYYYDKHKGEKCYGE